MSVAPALAAQPSEPVEAHDLEVTVSEPYTLAAEGPDVFRNFGLRVPVDTCRTMSAPARKRQERPAGEID